MKHCLQIKLLIPDGKQGLWSDFGLGMPEDVTAVRGPVWCLETIVHFPNKGAESTHLY